MDLADSVGATPFIAAANYSHSEVIKKPLASGAKVDLARLYGTTPLIKVAKRYPASFVPPPLLLEGSRTSN